MKIITIYSDGGSRGNPGPSGIGYAIYFDNTLICQKSKYIGITTNNVAEYSALLQALTNLKSQKIIAKKLIIYLDSELIVKQLMGEYKVKKYHLKKYYTQIMNIFDIFRNNNYKIINVIHVKREKNKLADKLVNQAIDLYINKKRSITSEEPLQA